MDRIVSERDKKSAEEEFHRGNDLMAAGSFNEAAEAFRSVIAIDPLLAEAWHNLGHACAATSPDEAEYAMLKAMKLDPDSSEFRYTLAGFYMDQERFEEAKSCYEEMLSRAPENVQALVGLGLALHRLDRANLARQFLEKALSLDPDNPYALNNLGIMLREQGEIDKSSACFRQLIAADPEDADAHWNLALTLLLNDEYGEGWDEYEWRFRKSNPVELRSVDVPRWQGEDLTGKTILVCAEQAYGDTFQFARFASLVAGQGAQVVFECQRDALRGIIATLPGITRVLVRGEPLPPIDLWSPLLSLPRFFCPSFEVVPAGVPYFFAEESKTGYWQKLVQATNGLRIGLAWEGRRRPDPRRSCPADELLELGSVPDATYYSLQVEAAPGTVTFLREKIGLVDLSGEIADFADTAALMASLDLVVTIDTAVAHLAGALGKPVLLMLPYAPDWRWGLGRDDSPWYPTMRLFRQSGPGEWRGVIGCVRNALESMVKQGRASR